MKHEDLFLLNRLPFGYVKIEKQQRKVKLPKEKWNAKATTTERAAESSRCLFALKIKICSNFRKWNIIWCICIKSTVKTDVYKNKWKHESYLEQIYYYQVFSIFLWCLIRQTFQQYHHLANRKMISFRKTCFVHLMALLLQSSLDRNRRSFARLALALIHRNLRKVFKLMPEVLFPRACPSCAQPIRDMAMKHQFENVPEWMESISSPLSVPDS